MKNVRVLFLLTVALLGASTVASAQSSRSGRTVEQQIYHKILGLPNYGVFDHIAFQYNGGTVTLTGKVLSLGTKGQAARVARDVPGVTEVVNNIENLTPSGFDDSIRRRLLREFSQVGGGIWLGEVNPTVRIIVDGGHVELEGYVNNTGTSNLLNIRANGVSGVFSVKNNLQVGDGAYR